MSSMCRWSTGAFCRSTTPTRILHTVGGALINAAALARAKDALSLAELVQQFVSGDEKLLKQRVGPGVRPPG